eukprot:525668-Pyramimonas_sp.AAC.1
MGLIGSTGPAGSAGLIVFIGPSGPRRIRGLIRVTRTKGRMGPIGTRWLIGFIGLVRATGPAGLAGRIRLRGWQSS